MVKIQLISDTHLEFKHNVPISVSGDILVLAGDVSTMESLDSYELFIQGCSSLYQYVVVIMGNHECWSAKGKDHTIKRIDAICAKYKNVYFLNKGCIDLMGIRFLGCTMWTNIPAEHSFVIEEFVNDYKRIRIKKNGRKHKITYKDVNNWHFEEKIWLTQQIEQSELPVVVVTHHSPIFDLKPKSLDYAYHSDLTELMTEKVKLWCHGHTHRYRKIPVGDTIVWCNPYGYPNEDTNYAKNKYIELDVVDNQKEN